MKVSNAVDGISIVDVHVCHMHAVFVIDDGNALVMKFVIDTVVQFINDGEQLGYCLLQIVGRPFFQCFCQNRVVRICTGIGYDGDGFVHLNATLEK